MQRSVSADTSKDSVEPLTSTIVRQQPLMAMLSPTATSATSRMPMSTAMRRPSPFVSVAAMRPTACTIPVNIRSSFGHDARQHAQIIADARHVVERQRDAIGQPRQAVPELGDAPRRIAQQARREVEQELVDHARREQRAVELAARLDVQLVDAARAQLPHQRDEIDAAIGIRQHQHLDAGRPERIALARRHDQRAGAGEHLRRRRRLARAGRRRCAAAAAVSRSRAR